MKGSVYRIKNKNGTKFTWAYVYDIGKDPATGKRKRKYKGCFSTKKEALLALEKDKKNHMLEQSLLCDSICSSNFKSNNKELGSIFSRATTNRKVNNIKGSVFKRKDSYGKNEKWIYRIDMGRDFLTGKRILKSKGGFNTKLEAKIALNKHLKLATEQTN